MIERGHISDYRLVDVLGRGGMGVVYQAIHDPSGQPAAVKTVRVATESTLESIRREIHTLRELRHPGVIAIRDHGVVDGMPWYAMELLRGRTLRDDFRAWFPDPAPAEAMTRDLLRPGKLREPLDPDVAPVRIPGPAYSLAHVIELFHKLCEPLAYVHGQGVIHRDLSPANVFVKGTNDPVLFDFGLAAQFRIDSAREVLEVGGLTRGTPHYMAPEQARGEVVDARADVYAVGCLLYEALTGRPPFLGDSTLAVMMQHIDDVPRRPASLVPEIPPALDDLVMRMLAKAPRDRIGYIEDVAAALERMGATAPRVAEGRPRAYTYRPGLAGRTELIDQIDRLLIALAAGTGGSAYLIGESGVGKTRLAGEIATRARDHDIRVITGECEPHGGPLHPLRPLLHAVAARCREGGRLEAQRLLGHNGAVLAAFEPSLAAFAPAADPHETSTFHGPDPITGSAARFRVLGVLRELLAELTVGEPLLLVLDDLQWADELTLALLGALGHELAGSGLFVLATMRAEEVTPELESVLAATGATRFDVRRLDRAAVGAMVRDMLALDEAAPTLTEFVASQSEGNPLFAAEYVRSAVDEGVLQRDSDGRWRLSPRDDDSYESLPTPGSVQSLMRRRLRTLSAPAREVSLAMAVLGRSCEEAVLAATVQLTADRAAEAITELIQRHVVEDHGDGQLRFVHDKLREQTYAELTLEQQRALHHRAAQAIEARYRDDADRQLHHGQLAYHWEAAGELARATDCLERAAEHALTAAAFGEAQAMLRHLLALPIASASTRRARWERRLGETCYALGDVAGLGTHTERALDELDRPLTGSRLRIAARIAGGIGQQLAARVLPRRRREGAERPREPAVVEAALASAQMPHYYFFNDDSLGLVDAALAAANLAERAGDDLP
ncbi:MAG: serine/threonine-protein kinase, partial [Kofleriaceae bacterium]